MTVHYCYYLLTSLTCKAGYKKRNDLTNNLFTPQSQENNEVIQSTTTILISNLEKNCFNYQNYMWAV